MTKEEFIKTAKENPDFVKALIQEADIKKPVMEVLKESGEVMTKDEFEGLKSSKEIILGEKKDLQKKYEGFQTEKDELQKELDKLKKSLNSKDKDSDNPEIAVLKSQIESLEGKLSESEKAKQELIGNINDRDITSSINKKLDELNVMPHFKDLLTKDFKSRAELKTADGKRYIMFDGKPEADFYKEWASSDTSKHFISAEANNGGGAKGGSAGKDGDKFDLLGHIKGLGDK